jgi:histidine triad (HIT) family protein
MRQERILRYRNIFIQQRIKWFIMVLSQEQLAQISQQMQGLNPEEQQEKMQEILSQLPPEDVEDLQKQQCPFCLIKEGKIQSKIVYDDETMLGVLDINPASKGHIILFPKQHYQFIYQMSDYDMAHMLKVAAKMSKIVIECMNAAGSNILLGNGKIAGQNVPHAFVHVIPRYNNDGINLQWAPKKIADTDMADTAEKIKAHGIIFEQQGHQINDVAEEIEYEESERLP